MSAYLIFVGFVLAVCGTGFVWLVLTALGLVDDSEGDES